MAPNDASQAVTEPEPVEPSVSVEIIISLFITQCVYPTSPDALLRVIHQVFFFLKRGVCGCKSPSGETKLGVTSAKLSGFCTLGTT